MYHYTVTDGEYTVVSTGWPRPQVYETVQEAVDAATGSWWRRLLHRFLAARIELLPGVHINELVAPSCCWWRPLPVRLHISPAPYREQREQREKKDE